MKKYIINVKEGKNFEKKTRDAVTYLEYIHYNEFFIAGFTSGTISIYSIENTIPLSVLSNIYDGPITQILLIEPGKFFVSLSENKMRYHYVNSITHERIEQKITTFY